MKNPPILFVDNLTVIDCAYLDYERGLVGESWIVDIALGGELDDQGMMMDFSHVKRDIKRAIDSSIDHSLVIPAKSTYLLENIVFEGQQKIAFKSAKGIIKYHSPEQAITIIESELITVEAVNDYVSRIIAKVVPDNVNNIKCNIRIERIDDAYYHYCHGLKKHDGNCQRIAHGHRSRIEIFESDKRNLELEQKWAEKFSDIYIGTKEDIVETNETHINFQYDSQQGNFYISLPKDSCYIIDEDSTVEHIASHLHAVISQENSSSSITVKAYEGVGKGAIAL